MKSKKLQRLEKMLRWMSIRILKKYKPKIVAITGSVGKTTTKEMIGKLLSEYYTVRKNEKNYNNEVGVPLTIIGANSGENSIIRWIPVFLKWLGIFLLPTNYPEILVLEMGADRPRDIRYLCEFVPIDVGVITNVGISHLEFFKDKQALAKEKGALLKSIQSGGLAVFNRDDKEVRKIGESLDVDTISYGFDEKADLKATDMLFGYQPLQTSRGEKIQLVQGIMFKLNYKGKIVPIKLAKSLGYPQIYAALAAFSVGEFFKINAVEAGMALEKFYPPKGRMILLRGIKNTAIIDDTYNSAPASVEAVLETLKNVEAKRKVMVMGDMLELGAEEEDAHRDVGRWAAELKVDYFITVGKRMELAFEAYQKAAPDGAPAHFENPSEAGFYVQNILEEGDVVLVKGSQGMRMEKIVEEIMAEPSKKNELLVRQDKTWLEKDFIQP